MKALGRVTTNGDEGDENPPMNPRGEPSSMNPEAYIGLQTPM